MRTNYIDWDNYFMMVSMVSGLRSKDPSTQVGACIVLDNKIIGVGYNGLPTGCKDEDYPWDVREGKLAETKYPYICHAELNAILNSTSSVKGATIYVSLFPCNECAKAIIQSGIKEIVYLSDKYKDTDTNKISKRMLNDAGVTYRQMELTHDLQIVERNKEKEPVHISKQDKHICDKGKGNDNISKEKPKNKSLHNEWVQIPYVSSTKRLMLVDRNILIKNTELGEVINPGRIIRSSLNGLFYITTKPYMVSSYLNFNPSMSGLRLLEPNIDVYLFTNGFFDENKNISLEIKEDSYPHLCEDVVEFIKTKNIYSQMDNINLFVGKLPIRVVNKLRDTLSVYDDRCVFHLIEDDYDKVYDKFVVNDIHLLGKLQKVSSLKDMKLNDKVIVLVKKYVR